MRALFGRLIDRCRALWGATAAWRTLELPEHKSTTIPPPPREPRISSKWHEPGLVRRPPPFPPDSAMPIVPVELDEDVTPVDKPPSDKRPTLPRRGHHARPRPPTIKRDKP